jgi:hypothetical protein
LGISYRGIGLYESSNKIGPKKIFPWSKLENLYYRDRKFSIEVHETQQSSGASPNVSPLSNSGNIISSESKKQADDAFNPVKVYAWFASIPSLCKSIWLMAVAQHQFYLDKKQNRHNILQFKSLNDLALELNQSATAASLTNNGQQSSPMSFDKFDESGNATAAASLKSRQISASNLFLNQKSGNDENNSVKSEMLALFKKQKDLLSKNLDIKRKQYQEIVGKQKEIEEHAKLLLTDRTQIDKILTVLAEFRAGNSLTNTQNRNAYLDNLCLESDTQKKIMYMSLKLASDPAVSGVIQKQRREFYDKSKRKLAKLEKKTSKEVAEAREAAAELQNALMNKPDRADCNKFKHYLFKAHIF